MSMPTLVRVLETVPVAEPGPDEVLIRVEAAPVNPPIWAFSSPALMSRPRRREHRSGR